MEQKRCNFWRMMFPRRHQGQKLALRLLSGLLSEVRRFKRNYVFRASPSLAFVDLASMTHAKDEDQ